jgi:3-hydroxyacyl-CoA dehydrogenase
MSMLDQFLERVAVLGAAGKMGSGISTLLLQEMARLEAEKTGMVGSGNYRLILIDSNEKGLVDLRHYLRAQIIRYAEMNIVQLRGYFANRSDLISNEEIVDAFVAGAMDILFLDTEILRAKECMLVFEAIVEDLAVKTCVLSQIKKHAMVEQIYFSNTSSIPISLLDSQCNLDHRIVGFHFYNPPVVQKLVELVIPSSGLPELEKISLELIKKFKKTAVRSNDVAGFIGNGHFIREIHFACQLARDISEENAWPVEKAIYLINKVSQEFLLRPMGIFQLIDYVGIDVCSRITNIMSTFLPDPSLENNWLNNMVSAGVFGGQYPDGKQKNGCFRYEQNKINGVYSLSLQDYWWEEGLDPLTGPLPKSHVPWKKLQTERDLQDILKRYFKELFIMNTWGAQLAQTFLNNSCEISEYLVDTKVAKSMEDVDTVLKNGFFHIYGCRELEQLCAH